MCLKRKSGVGYIHLQPLGDFSSWCIWHIRQYRYMIQEQRIRMACTIHITYKNSRKSVVMKSPCGCGWFGYNAAPCSIMLASLPLSMLSVKSESERQSSSHTFTWQYIEIIKHNSYHKLQVCCTSMCALSYTCSHDRPTVYGLVVSIFVSIFGYIDIYH